MKYYANANRDRGNGHKGRGLFKLAAPSVAAFAVAVGVGCYFGFPLLWGALVVAAYALLMAFHVLIIFKWRWGSEFWPTGKFPNEKKLTDLWMEKSVAAFALLGNPWFGFKMGDAGGIYFRCIDPYDLQPDNVARAEYLIGDLYGKQIIKATAIHVLIFAAFCVWRLI